MRKPLLEVYVVSIGQIAALIAVEVIDQACTLSSFLTRSSDTRARRYPVQMRAILYKFCAQYQYCTRQSRVSVNGTRKFFYRSFKPQARHTRACTADFCIFKVSGIGPTTVRDF